MDPEQHDRLRNRIREIIRAKMADDGQTRGGFLHLLPAIASAASALPAVISAGKQLFSGSGKHRPEARTHKPNAHAQMVKEILAEAKKAGKPMSLPEASKLAKQRRMEPAKPKRSRKGKKAADESE